MSEYQHPLPLAAKTEPLAERPPVDWEIVKRIMPDLLLAASAIAWLFYQLLPSLVPVVANWHGNVHEFMQNAGYLLMGVVFILFAALNKKKPLIFSLYIVISAMFSLWF
jgi:hypothetical protein